tara:strand:+ start:10343 stop:10597 length:255 start_codon:yes stop_codon:yes gene_type:complete
MNSKNEPLTAEQELRLLNNQLSNESRLCGMLMSVLTGVQVAELLAKFKPGANASLADSYTYWTLKVVEAEKALESLAEVMRSEV